LHTGLAGTGAILSILEILTFPNRLLLNAAQPVENVDSNLQLIIKDMAETMYAAPGVGLASTQVGLTQSLIVFDANAEEKNGVYQVLLNPIIVESHGEIISEDEGCLSVPDFRSNVRRAQSVLVKGLDRDGNPVSIEADGFLSIVLQHEIDHLQGKLFIDRISSLKRQLYKKRILKNLNQL
jgi:peptide deformylase